jgi:hypothetical protein
MSVLMMLAVLWWGLLGFLSFILALFFFVGSLGRTGQAIFFVLVGLLGQWLLVSHIEAEKRVAQGFVEAWADESADWPRGRMDSRQLHEFVDFKRIGTVNPYLALHYRMRYHSSVRAAGKEEVDTKGSASPVPAEVYLADVRIHSSEFDVDFRAKLRVWVATDNDRVVKFMFEGIEFL